LRTAFAGTPQFALPALEALRAHHQIVGVLTQPDRPGGRGRHLTASPVKRAALAARLPLAQPATLRSEAARRQLADWAPEVLVVVAYGLLLPPEVLALPRFGCLNIHASLLPRWRGAAPIQRALLAGDTESGVSIMQMDSGLDTGPVLLQRRLAIAAGATGGSLHDALAPLGAAALLEALAALAAGTQPPSVPQPAAGATYAPKIAKSEARIDWTKDAAHIERQVRAFNPWPVAETHLDGAQLRILEAKSLENGAKSHDPGTIVGVSGESMIVQCGSGRLAVTQVQRPGRKPVSAGDLSHSRALAGRRLG
jgi:methionyl-tRNA formyltransferase